MTRVIVKRRPDGILQIQRRSGWRALIATVPGAVLVSLVLALAAMIGLADVLVLYPTAAAVAGIAGLVVLMAARHAPAGGRSPPPVPAPRDGQRRTSR